MPNYDEYTKEQIRVFVTKKTRGHGGQSILKFPLLESLLDQIPTDKTKGQWAVFYNLEILYTVIAYKKVSPKKITFFEDCPNKKKIAEGWGCKTAPISVLFDKETIKPYMKKFDVPIGNPPYNKGILDAGVFTKNTSGYPHLAFSNIAQQLVKDDGVISLLMPASFMTLGSCDDWRRQMMAAGHIEKLILLDNRKNQVFDIEHTWICNMIFRPNQLLSTTEYVVISNGNQTQLTVDLSQYTYQDGANTVTTWPMFVDPVVKTVFEKVRLRALPLKREIGNQTRKNHSYIGYVLQGVKDRPVVNSTPKDKTGKQDVRSPGYILFDNDQEATEYCDFMNTDLYRLLITVTKCISKTQPQSIVQIGNFNFSGINTKKPEDFYQYFGLTDEEIQRVKLG
jgi:hypothetical protein